jgi:hypothetical protein
MQYSFLLQPRLGETLRAARENIEIAPLSDLFSKISMVEPHPHCRRKRWRGVHIMSRRRSPNVEVIWTMVGMELNLLNVLHVQARNRYVMKQMYNRFKVNNYKSSF